MTLDDREKLGPYYTFLLEAPVSRIDYPRHIGGRRRPGAPGTSPERNYPKPELGTGGELIQQRGTSSYLQNTLDYPDFIAADASAQRMHLAADAGALALGVDTADTIQAQNSAELMLLPVRCGSCRRDEAHGPTDNHDDDAKQRGED